MMRLRQGFVSDASASLIGVGCTLALLVLLARCLEEVEHLELPSLFSQILTLSIQLFSQDWVLYGFVTLFAGQLAMVFGLGLYCDCPLAVWLDLKLALFFVAALHTLSALLIASQVVLFEMLGLCSFRLIGHYGHRTWASRGALIALGSNRLGDMLLLLIATRLLASPTLRTLWVDTWWGPLMLLALGVKSITIVSFTWLNDAMEGPTPVSTLLHSATLVIAGLILYSRSVSTPTLTSVALLYTTGWLLVALSWQADPDAKKLCATSTSLMVTLMWLELLASGSAGWAMAVCHAQYKCVLFCLLASVVLTHTSQETRTMTHSLGLGWQMAILTLLLAVAPLGLSASYSKTTLKASLLLLHQGSGTSLATSSVALTAVVVGSWMTVLLCTVINDPTTTAVAGASTVSNPWIPPLLAALTCSAHTTEQGSICTSDIQPGMLSALAVLTFYCTRTSRRVSVPAVTLGGPPPSVTASTDTLLLVTPTLTSASLSNSRDGSRLAITSALLWFVVA